MAIVPKEFHLNIFKLIVAHIISSKNDSSINVKDLSKKRFFYWRFAKGFSFGMHVLAITSVIIQNTNGKTINSMTEPRFFKQ